MKTGYGKILAIAAPTLWAAIVFVLHVVKIPSENQPKINIPHADKIVHFIMFSVLAFLIWRSVIYFKGKKMLKHAIMVVVICLAYGAAMEWLQGLAGTGRESDCFDWFADGIGAVSGVALASTSLLSIFFGHQIGKAAQNTL